MSALGAPAAASSWRGAVIFLHGSGDSGPGLKQWVGHVRPDFLSALERARIKVVFPSAPARPYSMMGGAAVAVWFDRWALGPDAAEDPAGLASTTAVLRAAVAALQREGVPPGRIVLGGFSMGGGTALYCGLAAPLAEAEAPAPGSGEGEEGAGSGADEGESKGKGSGVGVELGGVFSLSSWVTSASALWPALEAASPAPPPKGGGCDSGRLPPVFMAHGEKDGMIDPRWGAATAARLAACSGHRGGSGGGDGGGGGAVSPRLDVSWEVEPGVGHEPGPGMLEALEAWILSRALP